MRCPYVPIFGQSVMFLVFFLFRKLFSKTIERCHLPVLRCIEISKCRLESCWLFLTYFSLIIGKTGSRVYLVQGQPLEISLAKIRSTLPLSAHFPGAHLTGDLSLMGPSFFFKAFLFILPTLLFRYRSSVVDPKLWAGSVFGKNHSGFESEQLRILNEFEVKLLWKTGKIWQFFHNNAQFKNINSFLSENIPLISLYRVIMSNITHLQGRNTKWIRNQLKSRIRIRKKSFRIHNTG